MSDEDDDTELVLRRQPAVRRKGYIWSSKRTVKRSVSEDREGKNRDQQTPVAPPRKRGSSLDLTPTLLTIYDNIAASNGPTEDDPFQEAKIKSNSLPVSTATRVGKGNSVTIHENGLDKRHTMINPPVSDVSDSLNDTRKRPLSISSMSSASSSSLPRQQRKRPNLKEYDQALLRSDSSIVNGSIKDVNGNNKIDAMEVMSARFEKKLNQVVKNDISGLKHLESFSKKEIDEKPRNKDRNEKTDSSKLRLKSAKPTINVKRSLSDADAYAVTTALENHKLSPNPSSRVESRNTLMPPSPQGLCPDSPQTAPDSPDGCMLSKPANHYVSYVQRVVSEIVETERTYVKSLEDIIQGYLQYLEKFTEVDVAREDTNCLFSNIRSIYNFSKVFLSELEACDGEPVKVAECFVRNNKGFVIYTEYCTNYPSAVEVLTKFMMDPVLCEVFKHRQQMLGHGLPLGAYLLRPVQRILKYHLLLQNIWKNFDKEKPGYDILEEAFKHMTSMAHHINNMKRKHEHAIKIQEIQSQLEDYTGDDLTRLGELVLESTFRVYGARASRHVFLFEKEILICKKKEGGMLSCKASIQCSNLMLVEVIDNEPLSFHIIPFDNPKAQHTLQARNMEQKRRWCQEIKRLILESYSGKIPDKVKSLVMELGRNHDEDFVSTENLDASRKHQHTAPEYLERRRVRRKSGGKLAEFNLLKPQKAKRGNRKSPDRRRISMEGSNQKISDDRGRTLEVNPRTGQKKARSLPRGGNLVLSDVEIADRSLISLDNSLHHTDLDDSALDTSPDVTKRAHSFRRATRLHPIYSTDMSSVPLDKEEKTEAMDIDSDTDDPNLTRDHLQEYNDCGFTSRSDLDDESDNERLTSGNNCNEFQGDTNGCDISSSLPTLLDGNDCDHLKSRSEVIISPNRNSINDDNECSKSVSDLMEVENEKKKTGIFRGRPHVTTTWIKSKKKPKASENKTITAFNDSFRKKSQESVSKDKNTKPAVQQLSNESDLLHAQKGSNARLTNWSSNDKLLRGSSTSLAPSMEDPWVKHSEVRTSRSSSVLLPSSSNNVPAVGRPRNKSDVTDKRALSRDNLDWMVYVNRNSLNEYPQNVKFLSKYCTPPRSTMTSIKPNKGIWRSESTKSDSVTIPHLTSPRLYPHSEGNTPTRGTNLSRSNSTPTSRSYLEFGRGFGRNRAASLDLDTLQESERIMEEMEDYMKHSPHPSLSHAKFPTAIPNNEEKDLNRLSGVSSLSTSSYDSQGSHSSSSDGLVGSLKNKISSWTAKMSKRNEEYEQMSVTSSVSDIRPSSLVLSDEEKYDNTSSVSSKSLSVSPSKDLPNFNYSQNTLKKSVKSNSKEPDLQSVLLEGGLGSSSVGSKLAHNLPPNIEALLANKLQSPTRPQSACVLRDTDSLSSYDFSSKEGTPEPSARHSLPPDNKRTTDAIMPATLKNTEFQQSDSGFSMQSDVTDSCDLSRSRDEMSNSFEEKYKNEAQEKPEIKTPKPSIVLNKSLSQSPEVKNRTKDRKRTLSNSSMESMDSFYERRLSAALDAEVFRDSAVFCDIEVDCKLKSKESTPEPERGVKTPRKSIRDYVQYLEEKNKPVPPKTFGVRRREPAAIIKQKLDHLKESSQYRKPNSRPASEERELSPPKCVRELQSTLVAETQGNQFRHRRGRAESEHSSESICSSNSSTLRSAKSLGRLDQLNNEVESLVIMKGWVQQLISKFQSDK